MFAKLIAALATAGLLVGASAGAASAKTFKPAGETWTHVKPAGETWTHVKPAGETWTGRKL